MISLSLPERELRLRAANTEEADRWAERITAVAAIHPSTLWRQTNSHESLARRATHMLEFISHWVRAGRAALLYHYLPCDKTLWGRLESPPSLVLMVIASWPELSTPWVRPAFFTILLCCVR